MWGLTIGYELIRFRPPVSFVPRNMCNAVLCCNEAITDHSSQTTLQARPEGGVAETSHLLWQLYLFSERQRSLRGTSNAPRQPSR